MKTIKKLFALFFLMSFSAGYAVDYCATPVTNTTGAFTLNYTCRKVATSTFELKLEFANTTTGSISGNVWVDNTGGANIQISALTPVWSNANKTCTYTFTIPSATNTPNLYVATIFVIISGVERQWNLPTNENFAAICSAGSAPSLTTTAATAVGSSGATMNGNISSNGGAAITSYGFYWSTTNGFANGAGTQVVVGSSDFTGDFSSPLSSLSPGTYYYKAYATNSIGTTYGAQQQFTISSNPPPVFGAWTLPAKVLGDANFTITPPTTDSSGAISYSSGTTSVAQIVGGNQIQIVGIGTSVITLNQAADATHAAGSTTATLTVTLAPAPTPPARNAWDVMSLYSGAYTPIAGVVHQHGTEVSLSGNATRYYDNMLLSRIAFAATNISAMTRFHADVYCTTIGTIWLQLPGSGFVTKTITATGWNSLDFPLSEFTGANLTTTSFFDFNNPTGAVAPPDNVYADNIYFYRPATELPPTLGTFTVGSANIGDPNVTITPPTSKQFRRLVLRKQQHRRRADRQREPDSSDGSGHVNHYRHTSGQCAIRTRRGYRYLYGQLS